MRIVLAAQDKASAAMDKIRQSGNGLAAGLVESQKALRDLDKAQRLVVTRNKLQADMGKTTAAMSENRKAVQMLGKEIAAAGVPTRKQAQEMARLTAQGDKLRQSQDKAGTKLQELNNKLRQHGITARTSAGAQAELNRRHDEASRAADKQRAALERLNDAEKRYAKAKDAAGRLNSAAMKSTAAGVAVTGGVGLTVRAAISEEDAMLGIVKQVGDLKNADNSINHANVAKMRAEIQQLAAELPMTTVEIMQMVAAGARMDTPREELAAYVRTAAQAATAFDAANPEELAENLGRIQKNFKLSAEQGRELADVINYLDDNAISKGQDIISYMNRVSGSMGLANISDKNVAALGSTLLTAGADESTASGAVSALFTRLSTAPDMKPVRQALKDIGMDANAVQKGMVEDAQTTVMTIIEAVKKMPKEEQAGLLKGLAGGEYNKVFAGLISNTEEWRRQIELANSEEAIGSMGREFETRMQAQSSKLQLFKNSLFNASAGLGRSLFDEIGGLVEKGTALINMFTAWQNANPKAAAALMKTIAVIGMAAVGLGALAAAAATVIVPMAAMNLMWVQSAAFAARAVSMLGVVKSAVLGLGKAFLVAGRFLLANPMLAVIAALAVAAWLVYKNWDKVKAMLATGWDKISAAAASVWQSIKDGAAAAWDGLVGGLKSGLRWIDGLFADNPLLTFLMPIIGIPRLIIANWSGISAFFGGLWDGVKAAAGWAADGIAAAWAYVKVALVAAWQPVGAFFGALWEGVKAIAAAAWAGIKAAASAAWQALVWSIKNLTPLGYIIRHWDTITAWLGGLVGRLKQIGSNIIGGLVEGIRSGFGALKSLWGQINSYLPSFMSKKMDIHSPSRVMRKMGGFIMSGLTLGIDNGRAALGKAYEKAVGIFGGGDGLLRQSVNALLPQGSNDSGLSFALAGAIPVREAMPAAMPSPVAAAAAPAGGNTYYITVNVPAGSSGEGIGRAVAAELDRREAAAARRRRGRLQDKD